MVKFQIRFLFILSSVFLPGACNQYRHLQKIQDDETCIQKFRPDLSNVIYRTSVDVVGKHLSGLLIFRSMPDSSFRVVFTNEMGLSFFDFGFLPGNGFEVYQVVPQFDKKSVIKTLRKDFDLVMFRNLDSISKRYSLKDSSLVYHACPQPDGINYYITDAGCHQLIKMQRSSAKKPVVEAFIMGGSPEISPDSILIRHLNFEFTITLKKITPVVAQ